jgi:ATPase family associated with various cellular activities (AAA)
MDLGEVFTLPDDIAAPPRRSRDDDSTPAPYDGPFEHLAELMACHDWLLRREVVRCHLRKPPDLLGFAAISDDEVDFLLGGADPRPDGGERTRQLQDIDATVAALHRRIDGRVAATLAHGRRLPIIELAHRFALSALEIDIVIACAAAELDRRYERIYGYLQDDMSRRQPSPGLVLDLVCPVATQRFAARTALSPLAPLRHYRIVEITEDGAPSPWLAKPMRVDERIVAFLLGDQSMDARIAACVMRPEAADGVCPAGGLRAAFEALVAHEARSVGPAPDRRRSMIYLHGADHAGADALVRQGAARVDLPVMTVDADLLCGPGVDFEQMVFRLFREGLLRQSAVSLCNIDRALSSDPGGLRRRTLFRCAAEMGSIVFLTGEQPWHWPMPPATVMLQTFELRPAGFAEQLEAWRALMQAKVADADLQRLMSLHPLPLGSIASAWRMARGLADLDDADGPVTIAHLEQACRAQVDVPSSMLARRIEPRHDWQDIVLPAAQLEQLQAMCDQARHAATVYGAWCFGRKLSLGRGLSALFTGPPGTGKTMAAEVIAAELKVQLLKIDLSQVASKYIGETEKNLRQLFDQAAAAHAILFFDEADALLGKRSAVKDAHDRYANTEIAYLLQKMEEYEGIAILATNLRQNMDEAFTRRLRFIVEFPFPEDEDRLRIWNTVWPREVPLAPDVDLPWLAKKFRLSGGGIRNVALAAAFLAAGSDEPVAMRHLTLATRRELQKMGRLVGDEEYRRHG